VVTDKPLEPLPEKLKDIPDEEFVWVLPEGALEELQKRVEAMKANKDK
jgi:hypothetical protein